MCVCMHMSLYPTWSVVCVVFTGHTGFNQYTGIYSIYIYIYIYILVAIFTVNARD